MAKFVNNVDVHDNKPVANYIDQIKDAAGVVHDIATHHKITFSEGGETVEWNGLTDLTVVIPTISELVQNPIVFVGTVDKDGNITFNDLAEGETTRAPKSGDLVFITDYCSFGGKSCEPGDMAIYNEVDGTGSWYVVSGEGQVEIAGITPGDTGKEIKIGDNTSVLTVEGKTLSLSIDYGNLNSHIVGGSKETVNVNGIMDVKYLKVETDGTSSLTVGKSDSVPYVTGLNNKNIMSTLQLPKTIKFGEMADDGKFPTPKKNETAHAVTVTGDIEKTTTGANSGDFVESITDLKLKTTSNDGTSIAVIDGISADTNSKGKEFVTGITPVDVKATTGYDFETGNIYIPSSTNFVTGGNVVMGIDGGTFADGEDSITALAYGFNTESTTKSADAVLSDVTAYATSTSSAVQAVVKNNVLEFTPVNNVVTGVGTKDKKYKTLKTATYTPIDPDIQPLAATGSFTTESRKFKFSAEKETTYSANTTKYLTVATPTIKYGSYDLSNLSGSIDANSFVVDFDNTGVKFPTYTKGGITAYTSENDVIGTVADDLLSTDNKSFYSLNSTNISVPKYKLSESESQDKDNTYIEVGVGGEVASSGDINLEGYVTSFK